jgi:hypothetical protein
MNKINFSIIFFSSICCLSPLYAANLYFNITNNASNIAVVEPAYTLSPSCLKWATPGYGPVTAIGLDPGKSGTFGIYDYSHPCTGAVSGNFIIHNPSGSDICTVKFNCDQIANGNFPNCKVEATSGSAIKCDLNYNSSDYTATVKVSGF